MEMDRKGSMEAAFQKYESGVVALRPTSNGTMLAIDLGSKMDGTLKS